MYLRIRNLFFETPDHRCGQNNVPDRGKANNQEFHQISIYAKIRREDRDSVYVHRSGLFFCIIQVLMIGFIREIQCYETDECNDGPGDYSTSDEVPSPAFLKKIQKKKVQQR